MTVRGPLSAGDITQLCRDVDGLLVQAAHVVVRVEHCDLTVVDAVSRLRVLTRRHRGRLDIEGDRSLLAYCGLDDVL
ncbi:MAG: hypothetical protein JWO22_2798 [Frankiales bacterium]|nr:hypothetical protein [Frankiales bacterium]